MRQLAIAEYPDISANARVVEHIGRQANNGFHKVVLQHIASDFAFTRTRTAREQWRTVEDNAKPATAIVGWTHFADQVHEKQQRTVGYARQARPESAIESLLLIFLTDFFFYLLPFHTKGRIGKHIVKLLMGVAVF